MNTRITRTTAFLSLAFLTVLSALAADPEASLERLQGQWAAAKTNQEGQAYSQIIEIKKDQLTFRIVGADSQLRLVSKGTVKAAKAGPFDLLSITGISAGPALDAMEPVDDPRTLIFTVRDGTLIFASNFDKERENEKPGVEIYIRKAATEQSNAAAAEAKLLGNWKMQVISGDNSWDYELRIVKQGDHLEGTQVSPRSGEHKCKTVQFKNGEVVIEVDREIENNPVTFVYQATLTADGLSGKAQIKGSEDQFNGTWKASKQ